MLPVCRDVQSRWLERTAPAAAADDDVASHLVACAACAEFVRRALRLQRAFADLERRTVPEELPGRVVAACNAGYLQDRAAALLKSIARVEAPKELDRQVLHAETPRLHAPQVLERLVDEDLRDPSKALARRFAGRLERLEAPAELLERVRAELARPGPPAPAARERSQALRWSLAGLIVLVGLVLGIGYGVREATAAPALAFRVERVQDVRELDGLARELAGGLTGGWSEITWGDAR